MIIKESTNKCIDSVILENYKDNHIKKLNGVTLEITYRCNLNCKMCFLHGKNGVYSKNKNVANEMSFVNIKKCIDSICAFQPSIPLTVTGGEPFVREDCIDICQYIIDKKSPLTIASNGTIITEEQCERIATFNNCNIIFSLDGTESINDFIRGKGNFSKTYNNALKIKKLNSETRIHFNYTISNMNYKNIIEFANFCNANGFNASFEHLWFTDKTLDKENDKMVEKFFGANETNKLSGFINDYNELEFKELQYQIARVISTKYDSIFAFFPGVLIKDIDDYYNKLHEYVHRENCLYHFEKTRVSPDGNVYPCVGPSVGNVLEKDFNSILNGKKYKEFRKILKEIGYFPNCRRCCKL